ncbi:hypothetical protein WGT02_25170 (plasmid) [Rhizobium sp. T1470]|uniref:hypothetical protein n=1 Tax=unclassified Rhizobium TaxID=2613769 RepID=UPI0030CEA7BA|nr:hypothetical protein [Rhizobium sp. T1473]
MEYDMKVTWDDIERATIEGVFIVHGRSIGVSGTAIDVWKRHPEAVFNTSVPTDRNTDTIDLVLSDFELPGEEQDKVAQPYLRSASDE